MSMLIAGDGVSWDVDGGAIRKHLGYYGGSGELASRAISDLGFAYISHLGDSLRVRLRGDMVSASLFEAIVASIVRSGARHVAIDAGVWGRSTIELFEDVDDAIAHLDALRGLRDPAAPRQGFQTIELDITRTKDPRRALLKNHFQSWRRRHGEMSHKLLTVVTNDPLGQSAVLARLPKGESVVPLTLPSYMRMHGEDRAAYLGRPFDEHPRSEYHARTAEGYRQVWRDPNPALELIEATFPTEDRGIWRIRFERLVLPWRLPDGEIMVSTSSQFRSIRPISLP